MATDADQGTPLDHATQAIGSRRVFGPFTFRHLVAMGGSLFVVGALLLLLTTRIAGPSPQTEPQPGSSFYVLGEARTGLDIGDRPPPLTTDAGPLVDLDEGIVDLRDYDGRPVWVVFWASWCPPCIAETPDLQRAYEASTGMGLELIAVSVQEPAETARDFATTYDLTYRIALDPTGGAFQRWEVFGLPTHYFIGRDGRIADRWFGPLSLDEMRQRIDLIAKEG